MDYEILNDYDILSDYALTKEKCLLFFNPIGVIKYKGKTELDEVLNHYKKILPQEVYHSIEAGQKSYILFDNFSQAHSRCVEWFPLSNEFPEEYSVYVHIFDVDGTSKFETGYSNQ